MSEYNDEASESGALHMEGKAMTRDIFLPLDEPQFILPDEPEKRVRRLVVTSLLLLLVTIALSFLVASLAATAI
jgi:hypothetical protein